MTDPPPGSSSPQRQRCDVGRAQRDERVGLDELSRFVTPTAGSLTHLDASDFYEWSVFHLFANREVIEDQLFPIRLYDATADGWTFDREVRPRYFDIGVKDYAGDLGERTLSIIEDAPPVGDPVGYRKLRDIAVVIRTKDAGINRLTYDIIFNTPEDYRTALRSNVFTKANVAKMLPVDEDHIVGTFHVDTCNAIKISIDRPIVSASADERDVFGAQQQSEFILMAVPAYAETAAKTGAI
jgi:hypothetical protein